MHLKFFFMLLIANFACGDILQTNSGPIRGKSVASGKVEAFLGIPYAEPPVGPLRFAKPLPKASWEDVYDAVKLPPPCIQAKLGNVYFAPNTDDMSEDCLYLNVWVPRQQRETELKPIIFYIHGGAYMFGSSNMELYDGATMAEFGDVVVVTINYRIGTLGFFYGILDEAEGNMGMYDQLAAIHWIKENAKVFQGDPENIILMGESAGAFSVSAHQISPLSRNLFNRAILMSGSTVNPLYSEETQMLLKLSQLSANLIGCASESEALENNPTGIIDCLKNVPAEKFSEADATMFARNLAFTPRFGDEFLPESSIEAYRRGHFTDKEVLLGVTRNEGTILLTATRPEFFGLFGEKDVTSSLNETVFKQFMQAYLKPLEETGTECFLKSIPSVLQAYQNRVNHKNGNTYLKVLGEFVGDYMITCGAVFQADFHSLRGIPVYFYVFDFRPPSTPLAKWMGVSHFEDVPYFLGNPLHGDFTEAEREFSQDIIDMLATFAKTGNPNIPNEETWRRYTYTNPKYFILGKRNSVGMRPDDYRCDVWRKIFGSVIDDDDV